MHNLKLSLIKWPEEILMSLIRPSNVFVRFGRSVVNGPGASLQGCRDQQSLGCKMRKMQTTQTTLGLKRWTKVLWDQRLEVISSLARAESANLKRGLSRESADPSCSEPLADTSWWKCLERAGFMLPCINQRWKTFGVLVSLGGAM